jgi:hypothetical protein
MLLTIGIILFIAWILGFFAFHVTAGLIHLLLVLAVVSFVIHLFTGRRSVVWRSITTGEETAAVPSGRRFRSWRP